MRHASSGRDRTRTGWAGKALGASLCLALASAGSSCNLDPSHRVAVESLGPERPELYPPESEYHRPGEPCALCHSKKGPADSEFALGGTVFWEPDDYEARVDNAYVRVLDARNVQRCFVTNCNGNFYVRKEDYERLTFPILVSVERTLKPGQNETTLAIQRMSGHIGREPSCATCHMLDYRDYASPGRIYLFNKASEFKAKNIPLVECPPPPDYVPVTRCPEDVE